MVRVLFTSCDRKILRAAVLSFLRTSEGQALLATRSIPKPWSVIVGTKDGLTDWPSADLPSSSTTSSSSSTASFIDEKSVCVHSDVTQKRGLSGPLIIDTITTKTFFTKQWIQKLLNDSKDLIVLDIKPTEHFSADVLMSFDKVYIGQMILQDRWTSLAPFLVGTDVTFEQVLKLRGGFIQTKFITKPDVTMKPTTTTTTPVPPVSETTKGSSIRPARSLAEIEREPDTFNRFYIQLWVNRSMDSAVALKAAVSNVIQFVQDSIANSLYGTVIAEINNNSLPMDGESMMIEVKCHDDKLDLCILLTMNELREMKKEGLITQSALLF
jgi:hypothetical protein